MTMRFNGHGLLKERFISETRLHNTKIVLLQCVFSITVRILNGNQDESLKQSDIIHIRRQRDSVEILFYGRPLHNEPPLVARKKKKKKKDEEKEAILKMAEH